MAVFEPRPIAPVRADIGEKNQLYAHNFHALTWERLEKMRLERLGISNRFSRHFNLYTRQNVSKSVTKPPVVPTFEQTLRSSALPVVTKQKRVSLGTKAISKSNSMAPFYTMGKPTCGYFFTRDTDNRKKDFGIPPSDLVLWRTFALQ